MTTRKSDPNYDRVSAVFAQVLGLSPHDDPRAARPAVTTSWDSLNHVVLVAALESEFGITIDPADSLEMTSLASAIVLLKRAGVSVEDQE